jgi:hypothetical protein
MAQPNIIRIQYGTVTAKTPDGLVDELQVSEAEGFEICGGPSVLIDGTLMAVVKRLSKEPMDA